MAFLTEDRRNSGCFLNADVYMNCMILSFKKFADKIGRISHRKGRNACKDQVEKFGVKTTGLTQKVSELSGGNQQKLLLARWLLPEPQIIILDEPTRGIDVGSKHDIYEHMNELIERGCSIIMISSELPEILGMSDRIVVMNGGRITGVLDRKEATQEKIMEYAADLANSEEAVG